MILKHERLSGIVEIYCVLAPRKSFVMPAEAGIQGFPCDVKNARNGFPPARE